MRSTQKMMGVFGPTELLLFHAVLKLDPKADFNRLRVSQLKQLLKDRGVDTSDCIEKTDFVKKVQELAATAM